MKKIDRLTMEANNVPQRYTTGNDTARADGWSRDFRLDINRHFAGNFEAYESFRLRFTHLRRYTCVPLSACDYAPAYKAYLIRNASPAALRFSWIGH